MQITLGQQVQYNIGEKLIVILLLYINALTPEKHQKQTRDNVVHHDTW